MPSPPPPNAPPASDSRIAIFVPGLPAGGAEQVMLTLAGGFVRRGHAVDLVLVRAEGALMSRVPKEVRLIELGAARVLRSVRPLARYLDRERPKALLSTLNTANVVAVLASRRAKRSTRTVIRQATHLSQSLQQRSLGPRTLLKPLIRWSYPRANALIAVSGGVADDLASSVSIPRTRVQVVPSPIVTHDLAELSRRPLDHPWFAPGAMPVVLAAGRLTPLKQFDLLIRAFASVRESLEARLVILGEGEERSRLERLIRALRLEDSVALPGFVDNPFAYMSRARLFVLSSAWEGLPGVLIQALACGTAIVATDCDSGPREILRNGELGRLVPVGDVAALAGGIRESLTGPVARPDPDACLPYTEATNVDRYLGILLEQPNG